MDCLGLEPHPIAQKMQEMPPQLKNTSEAKESRFEQENDN